MAKKKEKPVVRRRLALPAFGVGPPPEPQDREERSVTLNLRVTPTERRKVQELADRYGTTVTNVIGHLVAEAWEKMQKGGA